MHCAADAGHDAAVAPAALPLLQWAYISFVAASTEQGLHSAHTHEILCSGHGWCIAASTTGAAVSTHAWRLAQNAALQQAQQVL